MKFTLSTTEIRALQNMASPDLPKYVKPLLNLANQFAQATRPRVVGQMTELIQEFPGSTFKEWCEWYLSDKPGAVETATDKAYAMIQSFHRSLESIDRDMVRRWVEDLVLVKTYVGLRFQEAILSKIAQIKGTRYRLAEPQEESRGIDGFVGDQPISIKPDTYNPMSDQLAESLDPACLIVYYHKTDRGIVVEFSDS